MENKEIEFNYVAEKILLLFMVIQN